MSLGKLYVVGVGPGNPELLTIKGLRVLNEVRCICVPKGREEGSSLALSIVKQVVNVEGKEIVESYFPMRKTKENARADELNPKWEATVMTVSDILN